MRSILFNVSCLRAVVSNAAARVYSHSFFGKFYENLGAWVRQ